jgi:hypothetical protein
MGIVAGAVMSYEEKTEQKREQGQEKQDADL